MQLFFAVLLSLAISAIAFFGALFINNKVLDKTVYGDKFIDRMADKRFDTLIDYVNENRITEENINKLNAWCKNGKRVFLIVYDGDDLLFESSGDKYKDTDEYSSEYEDPRREYSLTLSDGTVTTAFLYYYAGDAFYYWSIFLSFLVSFLAFTFCFISFVHKKIRYIEKLKEDLDVLAVGDLNHNVKVEGKDELSELAFGLNQMRQSIIQHQLIEDEMRSSSSKLVTAMSHDLRTPLTSLLGYLELLDREKYDGPEQQKHFIKRSLGQANRIKTMADQLFEYFLVYSTEWEEPQLEPVEADPMLRQTWSEYAFSLESQGFTVDTDFDTIEGDIHVELDLIRRVFDNLYSNMLKYADPAKPIHLSYHAEDDVVILTASNTVSPERSNRESTNLGLNTCERIMKQHNGSFESSEENDIFEARMKLPLYK